MVLYTRLIPKEKQLIFPLPRPGKAFEITYLRLKFYTSRPESFAIYKRLEQGGAWLPYQYYSGSCLKTYGRDAKGYLRPGEDERSPACTEEFSDISPLTGGNVAFSTLEGRDNELRNEKKGLVEQKGKKRQLEQKIATKLGR